MKIEDDYSLEAHNTFHLQIAAKHFMEYDSEEELSRILRDEYFIECEKLHIGAGSNLLFLGDYNGIVLHSLITGVETVKVDEQHIYIRVGAGMSWDEFVSYATSNNWGGVENLSLIPGEIGAAAVQNIGAYGVEIKDVIESIEAYEVKTGNKRVFGVAECQYGYRDSIFKNELLDQYILTHVTLKLTKQPVLNLSYGDLKNRMTLEEQQTIQTLRDIIVKVRREKLPDTETLGNAGSFFKNPVISKQHYEAIKKDYPTISGYEVAGDHVKVPAGWLIEAIGFKGKSFDTVGVYEKQALVLVNLGNASGTEIAMLAESIRTKVLQQFEIEVNLEVRYVG
jgi:UDP-N-acetylmuramate dehydrogenase